MKIGAYQFDVCGCIEENLRIIRHAVQQAHDIGVRLLVFPECALTGYPPLCISSSKAVNYRKLAEAEAQLQAMADEMNMCIIAGSIAQDAGMHHNSARIFIPGTQYVYHKRALWGWDRDNFVPGDGEGIFEFEQMKFGVRICYEVRFPEYFRELYRAHTNLNIVLFHDVSTQDDWDRYDLIRAHIRTRAAENICPVLSVNASSPYQSAPTMFCDCSGTVPAELERGREGLLVYDFGRTEPSFSDEGRKSISDMLQNGFNPGE